MRGVRPDIPRDGGEFAIVVFGLLSPQGQLHRQMENVAPNDGNNRTI